MHKLLLFMGIMSFGLNLNISEATAQTEITIYNGNIALLKKSITKELDVGINEIVFNEIAKQMKPYSAYIYGDDISVIEQNYDFARINYANMLKNNIGKTVNTMRFNPSTGKNEFEKAKLIATDGEQPILKFPYGIEAKYKGQVLFDTIPENLNDTPILVAKVFSSKKGTTPLHLAYLSSGFSWKANYIAKLNDHQTLSLLGRVALTNNSGSDYQDIKIKLMAGDVHITPDYITAQPRLYMAKMATSDSIISNTENTISEPESLNGYYIYDIPENTDLKDGQVKLISFITSDNIPYRKINELTSPLSVWHNSKDTFKNRHAEVTYQFTNDNKANLGSPLPLGKISFYDKDKNDKLQFIGENNIANTAIGEEISLNIGKNFDIYANGNIEIKKIKQIDKVGLYHYTLTYKINNQGKDANLIKLKQYFPSNATLYTKSQWNDLKKDKETELFQNNLPLQEFAILSSTVQGKFENNTYIMEFELEPNEEKNIVIIAEQYSTNR